jgi:hypothetical protein
LIGVVEEHLVVPWLRSNPSRSLLEPEPLSDA